ncbi:serine protease inhibitor Kazal-type 1-like [Polypterus senegalus]|uniref:serine protease inhibitor Kazal-type 1-like n=1 Tax=Polypterus senegalus TaxID=55291 RepID=UPI001964652B|nr:serine protease inhibitor Kazal-type 1-like [Polypterus senegalus]
MAAMRLLLLCVALICLSDLTSAADLPPQPNCQDLRNVRCDILRSPMCGNDGRTYSNICSYCSMKRNSITPMYVVKNGAC